jgi:flagellar FliL protein
MAEEEEKKRKFSLKKIALFVFAPVACIGVGVAVGAYLFMPTQSTVEQVEQLIEKKLQQAGQLPSTPSEDETLVEPQKVTKETPSTQTFVTSYYTFPDDFTTNLKGSNSFLKISVGVSTQYDATVIENVEMHQLALRSEVLGAISEFTVEDVGGKEGREALGESIKLAMNKRLESLEGFGGIEDVFFTSFVLQ